MRAADSSGVEERGFSFGLGQIAPLTCAIAAAALIAASIFVVADLFRTIDSLAAQRALLSQSDVTQLPPGQHIMATAFEPAPPDIDESGAWTGVVQRGAAAYGLALLMAGAAYRRRAPLPRHAPQLGGLLATMPFGVACWTAEGRLLACNEQYRARLDAAPADVRPGASYAASMRRFAQGGCMHVVSEDDQHRVIELHREDGSCLMVDERPLAEGGFVTLVTDITETRRAGVLIAAIREEQKVLARRYHEEKLRAEAASHSKTAFLAHLSHDIRTPLNHIIGFAELMRHETYGPLGNDRYADYVESIHASGQRLLEFFAATLDLAEMEGGRRVLNPVELDVDDLLLGVARRFTPHAQRKGIVLALGAPALATITGDRFSLERMLSNLVDNAIRYTPPRGQVMLGAYAASDGVVLEVTDTGMGMSAERLQTVSQPFAFGDASLARERETVGLGLAIARQIAELSGGRLAIDSRPGLGTTVAISLPLRDTRAPAVSIAAE